ncbi:response regulator transcription factor [Paraconexibacter sp.]|uniref:response regulator transcription factor n=1 Tax=Paraconexibacter sp. TaxID=2949640 RepID=UPI003568F086
MLPASVIVADDSPEYLSVLRRAVDRATSLELVGSAADGREALDLVTALGPDIAICDDQMPHLRGIEVAERAVGDGSRTIFVIVSAELSPDLEHRADGIDAIVVDKVRGVEAVLRACHGALAVDVDDEEQAG